MFTGLVEEIGTIASIRPQSGGMRISVRASHIMSDVKIDDSISINGVCQTVVACTAHSFDVEAVEETMKKTTFSELRTGDSVNLERALQAGARLGGHIVQGHVDTRASIVSIEELGTSWLLTIEIPAEFSQYVVPVGSICIHGVSLTCAKVEGTRVTAAVIPHTWKNTILSRLRVGGYVNIEFDILGKYIERMLSARFNGNAHGGTSGSSKLTPEWLAGMGYA